MITEKEKRQNVERTRYNLGKADADDLAEEYADRKGILRENEPKVVITYPTAGLPGQEKPGR